MITEIHVNSIMPGDIDYTTRPKHTKDSYRAQHAIIHLDPHRLRNIFGICELTSGIYTITYGSTSRKDYVGKRITNVITAKIGSIEDALKVYDSRNSLIPWSEAYLHKISGGSEQDLAYMIDSTLPKTTKADFMDWITKDIAEDQQLISRKTLWSTILDILGCHQLPTGKSQKIGQMHYIDR